MSLRLLISLLLPVSPSLSLILCLSINTTLQSHPSAQTSSTMCLLRRSLPPPPVSFPSVISPFFILQLPGLLTLFSYRLLSFGRFWFIFLHLYRPPISVVTQPSVWINIYPLFVIFYLHERCVFLFLCSSCNRPWKLSVICPFTLFVHLTKVRNDETWCNTVGLKVKWSEKHSQKCSKWPQRHPLSP